MPTFRQLEIFTVAAAEGTFRKTAERLGISQPAVSTHLAALERELGVVLFNRKRGAVARLSSDGERILESVRRTLEAKCSMAGTYGIPGAPEPTKIRICTRAYFFNARVRPALSEFLGANPQLDLDFRLADSPADIVALVLKGEVDLAVYRGECPVEPGLLIEVLDRLSSSIYASPQLAQRALLDPNDLASMPFVASMNAEQYSWELECLAAAGIRPRNIVAKSRVPEVVAAWVLEGRGLAVRFDEQMASHMRDGRVFKVGPALTPKVLSILLMRRDQDMQRLASPIGFIRALCGGTVA